MHFSTVFMLTHHLSSKHPLSCVEQVVLQVLQQVPSHPQATSREHCLEGGVSTRLGSPTGPVGWGL